MVCSASGHGRHCEARFQEISLPKFPVTASWTKYRHVCWMIGCICSVENSLTQSLRRVPNDGPDGSVLGPVPSDILFFNIA